jgi:MFS family permease
MNDLVERFKLNDAPAQLSAKQRLPWRLYSVEALAAAGTNLLVSAIYFYTAEKFRWGLRQNFLLATGQGVVYVAGALLANGFAGRVERHRALAMVYAVMALLPMLAFFSTSRVVIVTALLLAYSFASSVGWPLMESLVSTGVDSHALSRRISVYNLVWSGISVLMLAIDGTLIVHWPAGVFLLPVFAHGVSALVMLRKSWKLQREAEAATEPPPAASHPQPEPELVKVRTLALWLSRGVLPATYIVIFSLMALMPSLPIMQQIKEESRTMIGSVWMAARCAAFLILGLGTWWHTRPRVLLAAAIVMLISFFGVTLRPSDFLHHMPGGIDLGLMVISQVALGLALGMIYAASLYFGMVLSDGSTEHGGYHEALIGAGFILGPGAGAVAPVFFAGSEVYAGIKAIGALVVISVAAVGVITAWAGRRVSEE